MLNIPLPSSAQRAKRGAFGRRLAIAFASVAALTAILAALVISAVWTYQFRQYVEANLERSASASAQLLESSYGLHGGWTIDAFTELPQIGMMSGLGLKVTDNQGNTMYDDSTAVRQAHSGLPVDPLGVKVPEGYSVSAPVEVNGVRVGTVKVWTYGSTSMLSESDKRFRKGSLTGLTIAALIAMGLATAAGLMYARVLVRPIERITETAESLRSGLGTARTGMDGGDQIHMLGKTLDEMADAIQADRELERRLTADVAHELRTPLQAIQATVEAMQDGVLPMDEEHLSTVRDETMRLARLADGILELTRLERGVTPMRAERLNLADPVRASVDALRVLYEARELVLSLDIAEDVRVLGDSDRLQQAVSNLLSNAARYTPEGGRVVVSLRRDDSRAVIEVADSGVGIAEEDLEFVFQRFWRASQARDRASGGLGIGLAVVKEIAERHGGTVGVARRAEGGSTFSIRLPLA
jgi:two-component system sensor histidine kinase BaeS